MGCPTFRARGRGRTRARESAGSQRSTLNEPLLPGAAVHHWRGGAGCEGPERATEVPRLRRRSDRKDDPPRGAERATMAAWSRDAPTFARSRFPGASGSFASSAPMPARWRSVPTGCPATSRPTSRSAPGLTDADAGRSKAVGCRCAPSAPSMTAGRRSARRATTSRNIRTEKWRRARARRAETPLSAARSVHHLPRLRQFSPPLHFRAPSAPRPWTAALQPSGFDLAGGHARQGRAGRRTHDSCRVVQRVSSEAGVPSGSGCASRPHDPCIQTARPVHPDRTAGSMPSFDHVLACAVRQPGASCRPLASRILPE